MKGHFTVRRSYKFQSGIWTDMTIERNANEVYENRGKINRMGYDWKHSAEVDSWDDLTAKYCTRNRKARNINVL